MKDDRNMIQCKAWQSIFCTLFIIAFFCTGLVSAAEQPGNDTISPDSVTVLAKESGNATVIGNQSGNITISPDHTNSVESSVNTTRDAEQPGTSGISPAGPGLTNRSVGDAGTLSASCRLKADFSAAPLTGIAPLTVQFTDLSTACDVLAWHWDFGDGSDVYLWNPSHVYRKGGSYTVSLIVTDGTKYNTLVRNNYITVTDPNPTITGITPATGANTMPISITNLAGTNFITGATVRLTRAGSADIAGTGVTVVSPTKITCMFDLKGKIAGSYNVVVTNPDGNSVTLPDGFTVTAAPLEPTVTGITPSNGANTATVGITNLAGTNFITGAAAMLTPVNVRPVHKGSITDEFGGARLISPDGIFVSGNYAYVTSAGSNALEIVGVTNPAKPVHKGSITDGTGGARLNVPDGVFVSDNYAYVTSWGSNALEIVDVSNPSRPVHKGSITDGTGGARLNNPHGVFVSGNYAYVASFSSNALEIVDISNPANPVHKGSITDGTGGALLKSPSSVFVSGTYAYVASGNSNALEIVDVSNPAKPVHRGSITDGTGGALLKSPSGVTISGNYAYVTSAGSNALETVDVSNPANPVHKGSITDGTGGALLRNPHSVYVYGNYAYVTSAGSNALEIVDVSNPAKPVHRGSITDGTGGALLKSPSGVTVSGNYAYVTSFGSNALEIVDTGTIPATGVTVVSPTKITCTFDLTNKIAGPYNVAVTNPDGNSGTLPGGFIVTAPAPTVTGITPSNGANTTTVGILNLAGTNFMSSATVKLNRTGCADIPGTSVTVVSPTKITCTFDLTNKTVGPYNVVVTNPDGNSGTLPGGFIVTGGSPVIKFRDTIGGEDDDFAGISVRTADGGVLLTGTTKSHIAEFHGNQDIVVAKYDSEYTLQWIHSYGGRSGTQEANYAVELTDGYLIVGGTSSNDGDIQEKNHGGFNGTDDIWVIKLNRDGQIVWQNCYGGTGSETGLVVIKNVDSTGKETNFTIAGWTESHDGDVSGKHSSGDLDVTRDAWIFAINATSQQHEILWQKCYGGTANDEAKFMVKSLDGKSLIVAGYSASGDGDLQGVKTFEGEDAWVFAIDIQNPPHSITANRLYGGNSLDEELYIQQTPDGGYIATGFTESNDGDITKHFGNVGKADILVLKLNSDLTKQWIETYGGSNDDVGAAVRVWPDRNVYYILGSTSSDDHDVLDLNHGIDSGTSDIVLLKTGYDGTLLNRWCFGGSDDDFGVRFGDRTDLSGPSYILGTILSNDGDFIAMNHGGSTGTSDIAVIGL
jgi:hypothetical protein